MAIRLYEGKDHTRRYAAYRPTYSDNVFGTIFNYYEDGNHGHGNTSMYELAVDVSCGNGQSSRPLCRKFEHVIGCDISQEQINQARTIDNIKNLSFKVCPGEILDFLDNESTDLVTIAQALHWLDHNAFFTEVKRALKPGGVLAAYWYAPYHADSLDKVAAHSAMLQFYSHIPQEQYLPEQRFIIEAKYRHIHIPFGDQLRLDLDNICTSTEMSVDDYIGYVGTRAIIMHYYRDHPKSTILQDLKQKLTKIYDDEKMTVTWPGFIVLGRKGL